MRGVACLLVCAEWASLCECGRPRWRCRCAAVARRHWGDPGNGDPALGHCAKTNASSGLGVTGLFRLLLLCITRVFYVDFMPDANDPDLIVERIDDDIRRVQDRAEKMNELSQASARVRGASASQQRDLAVEVDSAGRVTKLQIANQALSRGGSRVAAELMELFARAHQHAQEQMLETATGLLGEGDPVLEVLGQDAPQSRTRDTPQLGVVPRKSGGLW